jgi:PTH2 family peptidyl-tRNA hydrolase
MSSGKIVAQVAHAAVIVADTGAAEDWVRAGCPGRLVAPPADVFDAVAGGGETSGDVVDAGLTEVPPGTITVVALAPGPAAALPARLRP